jgi:hypothetical protein
MSLIVQRSAAFVDATGVSFPTTANRLATLLASGKTSVDEIDRHARSARISVLCRLMPTLDALLELKRTCGTAKAKTFFRTSVPSTEALLLRLVKDRPLVFVGRRDAAVLRSGMATAGDAFASIGTDAEDPQVELSSYISYDEMLMSALLLVSSFVTFINDGNRDNQAKPGAAGTFEPEGVFIGAVGARFERDNAMDSLFCVVDKTRSVEANGYGRRGDKSGQFAPLLKLMAPLFGVDHFPSWSEMSAEPDDARFVQLKSGRVLDTLCFARRIRITIDAILLEAEARGREAKKPVVLRVPGLGLGVWAVSKAVQGRIFCEQLGEAIRALDLSHIDSVVLLFFDDAMQTADVRDGVSLRDANAHNVRISFAKMNQSEPVARGKLLVAVFAWDSNAFPGNEFWSGQLTASGDPAAACSSTLAEIQNPLINDTLASTDCIRILV